MDHTPTDPGSADYTTAMRRVLGAPYRNGFHWPFEMALPLPQEHAPEDYPAALAAALADQRDMISWADSLTLRYDGRVSCCLNWLLRRAGSCGACTALPVTFMNGVYWRTPGGAATGSGKVRSVPAAITLDRSFTRYAEDLRGRRPDVIDIVPGPSFLAWDSVTLYRTDLLSLRP